MILLAHELWITYEIEVMCIHEHGRKVNSSLAQKQYQMVYILAILVMIESLFQFQVMRMEYSERRTVPNTHDL